jgi:hypothetical protein
MVRPLYMKCSPTQDESELPARCDLSRMGEMFYGQEACACVGGGIGNEFGPGRMPEHFRLATDQHDANDGGQSEPQNHEWGAARQCRWQ